MARRVTMKDVAALAGVSAKTVSNVLRGTGGASPATRERVLEAVGRTGYRLNAGAATLRSGRHGAIALAVPTLQQPVYADLASRLMGLGAARVVLELTRGEAGAERALLAGSWRTRCDALVLVPRGIDPDRQLSGPLDRAALEGVVLVADSGPGGVPRVSCPPQAQALLVASHLRATGRRRAAVVGVEDPADRWTGACVRVLRESGCQVPDQAVVRVADADGLRGGVEALTRLGHLGPRVDAVVCHNDALAQGAAATLLRRGVRVPQDVAVVGRGDTETAAYAAPALTSVSCAAQATAEAVVRLLEPVLAGPAGGAGPEDGLRPYAIEVAPALTVRASSQAHERT